MPSEREKVSRKRKTWRCFHCDEVFRSRKAAAAHFGTDDREARAVPACVDPLRSDEKARMTELREAQRYAVECMDKYYAADERNDELACELDAFKTITGCKTIHQLRMWMDSQRGRVVTANALIDGFRRAAPELADQIIG